MVIVVLFFKIRMRGRSLVLIGISERPYMRVRCAGKDKLVLWLVRDLWT